MEMSDVEHKCSSTFRIFCSRFITSVADISEVSLYMPFGTLTKETHL
jgi:hypothetical protein